MLFVLLAWGAPVVSHKPRLLNKWKMAERKRNVCVYRCLNCDVKVYSVDWCHWFLFFLKVIFWGGFFFFFFLPLHQTQIGLTNDFIYFGKRFMYSFRFLKHLRWIPNEMEYTWSLRPNMVIIYTVLGLCWVKSPSAAYWSCKALIKTIK